jgi:site-specific recombinase XerD
MQLVGRPKLAKPLPKALPRSAVEALLDTIAPDRESKRQTDWAERDLALILTALLGGLRAEELSQANVIVQVKPTNPLLKQRRTSHGYPSTERTASHCDATEVISQQVDNAAPH